MNYEALNADRHAYDATNGDGSQYGLVFNRMSPSAYLRGRGHSILYTLNYLAHLEQLGVRVVNGLTAFRTETSKALQLSLLKSLNLPFPAARDQSPDSAPAAAGFAVSDRRQGEHRRQRHRHRADRRKISSARSRGGQPRYRQPALVRIHSGARRPLAHVEVLGYKYLYAINVYSSGESFNLCPADICQSTDGVELARGACPVDAPKNNLRVERADPDAEIITDVERIMRAADIEIGGVEYMIDDRDGQRYYYDINALSNFVADAPRVIGFDPFLKLADYLEQETR